MTHRASLSFVFAIVLIDMLGFGIVIPVFPGLIMHLARVSITQAAEYAGWLGAGYAVMQFVFAPVIGNLSDRFGRRPVLLAAVFALGLDYLLQAFAPAMSWLVAGRIIAGITGASFSAAYAYIADVTPPEKRAASFGLMGMAFGIGFVAGPALGGLLGTLGPRVPFMAAAGLSFANFLFGLFTLRESLDADHRRPFDWRRANALSSLRALKGQSAQVLWFVAALGAWQLANVVYPAIWTYMAIAAYGFSTKAVGLALAVVGLSAALFQGLGMRYLLPRLGERRAVIMGVASLATSAVLYCLAHQVWQVYLAIAVGAFQGAVQPSISAMNSRAVDARSQGELQGAVQSIGSIAQIIGPPLYAQTLARFSGPGALIDLPTMPMLVASVIALAALVLFLKGARRTA
ncbi:MULTISPECIES: MFS transporter [unclassified Novosphingobium]|uniref:MFS transporter n=1 Tax=unclassified Novosphingobium TaxID=2644732 RepID=UPI0014429177|nr:MULTISPECIES: MFS transporter [unclassified Novosphingobium]MBB3359768.1 DHA1 family tetracycline resistance protein-like MFS transporter [Novosphingobium sp. BK256]MBB3376127.1 DHA1 family tetracycline resistance protein-like MFS transporter [Novosphingobium sp. BK280]MBB3380541.1 DHA1 family tetracycline resistance protein-like MFS transporter [Novosphingobium sp. BK258]MBB3422192.1 DHA1 family tetracycline resistance protein-like MFS transporter [Novosphingobium sp. BK267]MBB3450952.1 DH